MRALLPDALLPDAWRLQERTGIVLGDDGLVRCLAAEGDLAASEWERFPGELWTAAPVMAHAHLESWDAPAADWQRAPFSAWVQDLVSWRGQSRRMGAEESAGATLDELGACGCGLVAAHVDPAGASPELTPVLGGGSRAAPRPECLRLPELLAPDPAQAETAFAGVAERLAGGGGVALHAPYSVSERLAARVFSAARRSGAVVSVHLGEHEEERKLLRGEEGPLGALLARLGSGRKEEHWNSPVDWLSSVGGLQPGTLAVHAGVLDAEELRRLAAAGVATVYCPGAHAWFGRGATAFEEAAVPAPALGCDSRASNEALDPLREYRLAVEQMPAFSPQVWWNAATLGGAQALHRPRLGTLNPGRMARALRLPAVAGEDAAAACARLAAEELPRQLFDPRWC